MKHTNEEKMDLFCDILEPAAVILSDPEVAMAFKEKPRIQALRDTVRTHKAELVEIMARVEGAEPDAYEINGVALLLKLVAWLNTSDVKQLVDELFTLQDQSDEGASSGPAMEVIQGGGI